MKAALTMYQFTYSKTIISIGIYSKQTRRVREAELHSYMCTHVYVYRSSNHKPATESLWTLDA